MRTKKTLTERKPKTAVIVLNYNGKQFLDDCLSSLKKQTFRDYQVWVLDNASSDGSVDYIKKRYPWVKVIENERNDGTAEGSNVAARNTDSKYIVFMSNDIKADKNCLKYLVETLDEDEKVAICSSKLLRFEKDKKTGKYLIDNVGGDLDIYGFGWPRGVQKTGKKWDKKKDVAFSYGGSFIIRRQLFEKIGGYDRRYFTLGDDIDFSWRIQLLGYRVVVNPASFVYHKVSATLGVIYQTPQRRFWSERNCLRTLLKNYEAKNLFLILPRYFVIETMEMGFFLFLKRQPRVVFGLIKAFLWNLVNLPDTLRERVRIQKMRVVGDKEILKMMLKKSLKLATYKLFLE
ncbi:glycosyltransferase family 2 protein [Patescibacteria group bacterium]|nr:glycosyltransferase family 2 protein [Patescibacteria group bacterium]